MTDLLEVGKTYVTRSGVKVRITKYTHGCYNDSIYPYKGEGAVPEPMWTSDGRYYSYKNSEYDIIEEYKEEKEMYPTQHHTNTCLALNAEKKFVTLDKDTGETELFSDLDTAKSSCTRKLREGKEFLVLQLVCSVRPKPIDAEIEEW